MLLLHFTGRDLERAAAEDGDVEVPVGRVAVIPAATSYDEGAGRIDHGRVLDPDVRVRRLVRHRLAGVRQIDGRSQLVRAAVETKDVVLRIALDVELAERCGRALVEEDGGVSR
mgnify:CR=1 FL=1